MSNAVEIAAIIERWGDYIRAETLADDLVLEAPQASMHIETIDLDGRAITIGVTRHV